MALMVDLLQLGMQGYLFTLNTNSARLVGVLQRRSVNGSKRCDKAMEKTIRIIVSHANAALAP